jgi:exonuclease SbcC
VLTEQRKAVVELLAAHKRAASLEDQLRSQSALLDSALLERGFVDIAQARTEQPVPGEVEQLNLQVNAFVAQEQRISAVLADPTLIKAAKSPAPDLAMLTQLEVAATERLQAAGIVTNKAQELGAYLEARSAGVEQGIEAIGPLLAEYETTRRLANLCAGRDGSAAQKNRLSTYVLASRLEQVALVASERLLRMSNGRYSLLYTDEAKDGRNRGGLGLKVFDAHTGKERETTTLSGGESFFASLALALGVADVVTAESGGLAIETLFIDEGFGTLDEDTLNEVMVVLEDLKAGGRRVGIVSHVAELRSRIPKQLEVVALERGSTLRVSAGQQ